MGFVGQGVGKGRGERMVRNPYNVSNPDQRCTCLLPMDRRRRLCKNKNNRHLPLSIIQPFPLKGTQVLTDERVLSERPSES